MYHQILEGLREFMGFETVESPVFYEYLQSLQESVIQLRQAYKNNFVTIDYTTSNIQAAYMLAYFPQYVDMAYTIFESLNTFQNSDITETLQEVLKRKLLKKQEGLTACFFAAGPAPESVALCKYITEYLIKENLNLSNKIKLNTFDINWHSWSLSRHLTRNHVLSEYNSLITGLIPHQINLLSQGAFNRFEEQIKKADILFFQNCLNEVVSKQEVFLENVKFLLNTLADDSILIIGDFCNYPSVMELFKQIEVIAEQNLSLTLLRSSNSGNIHIRHNTCLPEIITKNLLTGGNSLIPKKNVSFNYIVVYKPGPENIIQANQFMLDDLAYFLCNRGIAKGEVGQYLEAIEDLTKAVNINPNLAMAYNYRGLARNSLKQPQEAIEDYIKAININPNLAVAYYNKGLANYQLGQSHEAIEDYTKAININPNLAMAYYYRGFAKAWLEQYQESIEDLTEAININPNLAMAYYYRGFAKTRLEQYQEAIEDYTKTLHLNPDFADARLMLTTIEIMLSMNYGNIKRQLKI
jgi:tetratricopeptide (TPR) repeat protein